MSNILILESHHKTKLFIEGVLLAYGNSVNITLLSVVPAIEKEIKNLYPFINIVCLCPTVIELNGSNGQRYSDAYKVFVKNYSVPISKIIHSDRRLRKFDKYLREKYIGYLFLKITDILYAKEFEFSLLEATWTHEQVFCILAKERNLKILVPVNDKMVSGKFNIFDCPLRISPYKNFGIDVNLNSRIHISSSKTFAVLKTRNAISLSKLKRMVDHFYVCVLNKRNRFIHDHFVKVFLIQLLRVFRYYGIRFCKLIDFKSGSEIEKIVQNYSDAFIVYLHVQPEAGIDVIASKFSDQLKSVFDLRMATSNDIAIFVKDHPHDVGRKSILDLRRLGNLNDVFLVSPWHSSSELINDFDMVHISFAGTITIEAVTRGKRSVCLGDTFFTRLGIVPGGIDMICSATGYKNVSSCLTGRDVMLQLEEIQFSGNVGAPNIDSSILDKENLHLFSEALKQFVVKKDTTRGKQ